jgi:hypothetical protein
LHGNLYQGANAAFWVHFFRTLRRVAVRPDSILQHLGAAARDARVAGGRLQVHVAAQLSVDQGTIRKFEQGKHWPRDPDAMVAAYARDLDMDPRDIWDEALRRWRLETR